MLSFSASPATRVANLSIKGGEVVYQSREREREVTEEMEYSWEYQGYYPGYYCVRDVGKFAFQVSEFG